MTEATLTSVNRSVTVQASPERAFEVFTAGFSSWWPIESHHIGETMAVEVVIEPRAGGRWFERDAEGAECDWGFVTGWDPPRRLVLSWHLTPEYEFDPDPGTRARSRSASRRRTAARSSSSSTAGSRSTPRPARASARPSPARAAGPS